MVDACVNGSVDRDEVMRFILEHSLSKDFEDYCEAMERKAHQYSKFSTFANLLGEGVPHELSRLSTRKVERADLKSDLPLYLQAIRSNKDIGSRADRHKYMFESFNEAIKGYLSSERATTDWIFAWRLNPQSELAQFVRALHKRQALLLSQAKYWVLLRCVLTVVIFAIDYILVISLAAQFFERNQTRYAALTLSGPFLCVIVHAIIALAQQEAWYVIFASICGLKPLVDALKVITGAKHDGSKRIFRPLLSMAIGKGVQLTCHDIPQTCIQCYIIIQLTAQGDPVSALQYAVLIVCVIVAGSVGSGHRLGYGYKRPLSTARASTVRISA